MYFQAGECAQGGNQQDAADADGANQRANAERANEQPREISQARLQKKSGACWHAPGVDCRAICGGAS